MDLAKSRAAFMVVIGSSLVHATLAARQKDQPTGQPSTTNIAAGDAVPTWLVDPRLTKSLDFEFKIQGYRLRLPSSFKESARPPEIVELQKRGMECHLFGLDRREDGSANALSVTLVTLPSDLQEKLKLADAVRFGTIQVKRSCQDYMENKTETGRINGMIFQRTSFTGRHIGDKDHAPVRGVVYCGKDKTHIVVFELIDLESHYAESAPLGEASIMSFRND